MKPLQEEKQSCQESKAVYQMKTGVRGWNSLSIDTDQGRLESMNQLANIPLHT